MEDKKMTKVEMFTLIADICKDNADVVAFCENEITHLQNKAEKAKIKAAEKRAAGDELYAAVVATLTVEPQTREEVLAQLDGEELTPAKITARLTQAVKNGAAVKSEKKVDGKSKTAYSIAE